MHQPALHLPQLSYRMIPGLALGANWFAGLSLGFWAARLWGDTLVSLVAAAASVELSFPGALAATVLSLLLSACAVFLFHRCGAYAVSLLRGLGLGLMLGAVLAAFRSGALLLSVLLLFSRLVYSPVLLWYLWRRLCFGNGQLQRDTLVCLGLGLAVAAVDYLVVSPFLAAAISH